MSSPGVSWSLDLGSSAAGMISPKGLGFFLSRWVLSIAWDLEAISGISGIWDLWDLGSGSNTLVDGWGVSVFVWPAGV